MVKSTAVLLDANVLLALGWSTHEHHDAARRWFKRSEATHWATCPLTQLAFVRLSSNPHVVDPVATPQQAAELLRRMVAHPRHVFWSDTIDLATEVEWPWDWVVGHRQVTDSRLVLLAKRNNGRLATFDRRIAKTAGAIIELIPSG